MGFIILSGTGEDGPRLLWRWVLGGDDTTRLNGKRRFLLDRTKNSPWGWPGTGPGLREVAGSLFGDFQELAGQSPVQHGLNLVFTLL